MPQDQSCVQVPGDKYQIPDSVKFHPLFSSVLMVGVMRKFEHGWHVGRVTFLFWVLSVTFQWKLLTTTR